MLIRLTAYQFLIYDSHYRQVYLKMETKYTNTQISFYFQTTHLSVSNANSVDVVLYSGENSSVPDCLFVR